MTERAIEDWLTSASERGYQTAFCHLLNAMGYVVLHSTTHGPSEEGKDVIARDSRGRLVAFQLKRGGINVATWRGMKAEVEELVEYPIKHASVRVGSKHKSYLVTTGHVNEYASSRINSAKESWRKKGYPDLEVWAGYKLLSLFCKHTGHFLPQPIPDFHRLLGFMIADGSKLLDKDEFHLLLMSLLPTNGQSERTRKTTARRAAAASLVITEYALAPCDKDGNHFARIEAYTMLACYIWAESARLRLPKSTWSHTIKVTEIAVDRYAQLLFDEWKVAQGMNPLDPAAEPLIGPFRAMLIGGVLAAHGLWVSLGGRSEWFQQAKGDLVDAVAQCQAKSALPSEYFVPHVYLMAEFLRQQGRITQGREAFFSLIRASVLRKQNGIQTSTL